MTKDKELEALFLAQKHHFDDSAEFMEKLTKRLDAVEFIKQYQVRSLRRYKIMVVAVFVVGILCGGISTWWLLSSPSDESLFCFSVQTGFLLWLAQNARLLAAAGLSLLMTVGICSVISNILDIMEMCRNLKGNKAWLVM